MSEVAEYIPNNSLFGARLTTVEIYESTSQGDDAVYQAAISIVLDDGSDTVSGYSTTVFTELYHTNVTQLAKIAFLYTSTIFPNMNPEFIVYDLDGNLKGKYDFKEVAMAPIGAALH